MYGWIGKILHIDLNSGKTRTIPTQAYAEKFLGGRGVASRIYWETVTPQVGAFAPENRLIFMTGPLVATGVQGASRMSVVGKSPMTYPEGYCYGNIGDLLNAIYDFPDPRIQCRLAGTGNSDKISFWAFCQCLS